MNLTVMYYIVGMYESHCHVLHSRDVWKTEIRFGFGFKNRTVQNLTCVQTDFRQKLHAFVSLKILFSARKLRPNTQSEAQKRNPPFR